MRRLIETGYRDRHDPDRFGGERYEGWRFANKREDRAVDILIDYRSEGLQSSNLHTENSYKVGGFGTRDSTVAECACTV